jgi:hypothetical protein
VTTRATLQRDIAAVAAALDEACAQADGGALLDLTLDLTGLDERVGVLCTAASELPGAQAKALLPDLEALIGRLDALAVVLTRQHNSLLAAAEGRPDPHTVRRRASAAYGRASSPDTPADASPLPRPTPEEPT